MRRRILGLVLPLALAPLIVLAPAGGVTPIDVALTGFRDIVVDQAHGHVFISQGTSTVVVTDLAGVAQTPLTGLTGASGMTLSDDGGTLWVTLSTGDAVAAVDTTTLAKTTYPTGAGTCPSTVAATAGMVWFGGACDGQWGNLRALNPGTGAVSPSLASPYSPIIATSPGAPGKLFVIYRGISPTWLYAYTATGGDTPSLVSYATRDTAGSNGRDLAVTPDGTKVIVASGAPYYHQAFTTSDLSSAGTYGSDAYPNAVAVRPDGMVAAGIDGSYHDDIYVYPAGSDTLLRSYELGAGLRDGGLAFGTTNLYAVTGNYDGTNTRLHVITPRGVAAVQISTDKSSYSPGATAHVTATLATGPADGSLSIYAQTSSGKSLVTTGQVDAGRHLVADVVVNEATTFSVEYAGSADYDPDTATTSVTVLKKAASVSVGTDKTTYAYGATAHVTAHLTTASTTRTVSLYKTVAGVKSLVKSGSIAPGGQLTAAVALSRRTTFSVAYAGDAQYVSAAASRTVTVAAKVTGKLIDYHSRSGQYYLYRAGERVLLIGTVAPNHAGECLYVRVQFLINGHYGHDATTPCVSMTSASKAAGYIDTTRNYRGHVIRLRAEWHGSVDNKAANSSWRYAKFN